jgi:hypothetical protein
MVEEEATMAADSNGRVLAARAQEKDSPRTGVRGVLSAGAEKEDARLDFAEGTPLPGSLRELGTAIFTTANPVQAGAELLDPGDKKADPTRLNALKTFAEWVFGKPGGEAQRKPPRVIWDIPCPPYEPVDPVEPQDREGGEE